MPYQDMLLFGNTIFDEMSQVDKDHITAHKLQEMENKKRLECLEDLEREESNHEMKEKDAVEMDEKKGR